MFIKFDIDKEVVLVIQQRPIPTVGHVWVKQVSGAVVVMGLSIRAPVGFTKS